MLMGIEFSECFTLKSVMVVNGDHHIQVMDEKHSMHGFEVGKFFDRGIKIGDRIRVTGNWVIKNSTAFVDIRRIEKAS